MKLLPSLVSLLSLLFAPLLAIAQDTATPASPKQDAIQNDSAPAVTFAGNWKTTYGLMKLVEKDGRISGSYTYTNYTGHITGTVEGRKLNFTYSEPQAEGEGEFELSEDGNAFTGKWKSSVSNRWMTWSGERAEPHSVNYSGLWQTEFGPVRLHQSGNSVEGVYQLQGKKCLLHGTIDRGKLSFDYIEPKLNGSGWSRLSKDLQSFTGKWKPEGSSAWRELNARRIQPQQGLKWLVVLEARWEGSLRQQEYSFGEMLKSFFARTPRVQVRHRFFTNEAALQQWCEELAFIAEPVTLLISSHGTKEGVIAGHEKIAPEKLAGPLSMAGNLKLIHFASCCVMGGDAPKIIHEKMKQAAAPPISGYGVVVDWAASAVIDFTYLDLILSRGMSPEQAAAQVKALMPFAGKRRVPGTVFPAADFRIQPAPKPAPAIPLIKKVSMWGDLRTQPVIDLGDGLKIRLGVEATSAPASSGVLVYCLLEGQSALPEIGNSEDTLGPIDFTVRILGRLEEEGILEKRERLAEIAAKFEGNERLYARSAVLHEPGVYKVEIRKRGKANVVASTTITATDAPYHAWVPFHHGQQLQKLRERIQGEEDPGWIARLSMLPVGSALPAMPGSSPIEWTGRNRKISDLRLLPTLIPRAIDPKLKLKIGNAPDEKNVLVMTIESDEDMLVSHPESHYLARWWVDGKAFPSRQAAHQVEQTGRIKFGKKTTIYLEFEPKHLGAQSGDKIGLQLLHVPEGWSFVSPMEMVKLMREHSDSAPKVRMTNKVEFVAP